MIDIEKIKIDFATIKTIQMAFKNSVMGRFVQALSTPAKLPLQTTTTKTNKLRVPTDENEILNFVPVAKNIQYRVDVWKRPSVGKSGATIIANCDLGDGEILTIIKNIGDSENGK